MCTTFGIAGVQLQRLRVEMRNWVASGSDGKEKKALDNLS
jgi:hypothetical protein